MNTNIKIFLLCPIPEEQKPINQYIALKENFLTSWTSLSTKKYRKKIFSLYCFIFLFVSILQFSSLHEFSYLFDWILKNLFISTIFLVVLFVIILFRWVEIQNQFNTSRFFYEETSWYDGQIWEKPFLLIKNDKLISSQKIEPIVKRIQKTLFYLVFFNYILLIILII